jgi:hypothetical protein
VRATGGQTFGLFVCFFIFLSSFFIFLLCLRIKSRFLAPFVLWENNSKHHIWPMRDNAGEKEKGKAERSSSF